MQKQTESELRNSMSLRSIWDEGDEQYVEKIGELS
jgi:hypothetical protein